MKKNKVLNIETKIDLLINLNKAMKGNDYKQKKSV